MSKIKILLWAPSGRIQENVKHIPGCILTSWVGNEGYTCRKMSHFIIYRKFPKLNWCASMSFSECVCAARGIFQWKIVDDPQREKERVDLQTLSHFR